MFEVVEKKVLNSQVKSVKIRAPFIAKKARPGQFIMYRVDEYGERVPLTIADYDAEAGTITLIFQEIGRSTKELGALDVGDTVLDVVGPLGNPTEYGSAKKAIVIGGGVGCAIAYPQAKFLHENGVHVDIIAGFRNKDIVILEDEMKDVSNNLYITTDDGSYGEKGLVTDVLKRLIDKDDDYDLVIAIGPIPMMKFVCLATEKRKIKTIVSLNPIMIDGTGMCGGCRVSVGGDIKFACVDGPDFDGHKVDFDELMKRNAFYGKQEREASDHACRLGDNFKMTPNMAPEKVEMPHQCPEERIKNFDEVALGYTEEMAREEASRCIQCKTKPCTKGCPVGVNIPRFIYEVAKGDFDKAYEIISESNCLPSVTGRVCPQENQCEGVCVRGIKNEPVAIGRLERFVSDWYLENRTHEVNIKKTSDKKIAVVGSGPAGIACASQLADYGYDVTIFEAMHIAGGVLAYGIPEFRLPREVVDKEIDLIEKKGVKVEMNMVVGRTITIDELMNEEGFDAVFIGSGAGLPNFLGIEGEGLVGVYSANEFLTRINLMQAYKEEYDTPIKHSKQVAVVGAGNVAMDVARSAKRLGAENVYIVYRRSMDEIPARAEEVLHAKEEGIEFKILTSPVAIKGDEDGKVCSMECVEMELSDPDESGRRRPVEKPNSNFELEVDAIIMAVGTSPNPLIKNTTEGVETDKWGCLVVNDYHETTRQNVYAGGDIVTGAATVILAMGAGKEAAVSIHERLSSI